jgi:hypothetical protein
LAAKQKALPAKLRGSIKMKNGSKYKFRELAHKALYFARKDQSLALQAFLLCAPSKKACGKGFLACR